MIFVTPLDVVQYAGGVEENIASDLRPAIWKIKSHGVNFVA